MEFALKFSLTVHEEEQFKKNEWAITPEARYRSEFEFNRVTSGLTLGFSLSTTPW